MIMHFSSKPFSSQMPKTQKNPRSYYNIAKSAYGAAQSVGNAIRGTRKVLAKRRMANSFKEAPSKKIRPNTARVVQSSGDGVSKSRSNLTHKAGKGLRAARKITPVDIYREHLVGQVNAGYGQQGTGGNDGWLNASMVKNLYAQAVATTTAYSNGAVLTTNALDKHFFLETFTKKLTMANQGPSTIKVVFYDLICKLNRNVSGVSIYKPKQI